jgi:hypothetical protein
VRSYIAALAIALTAELVKKAMRQLSIRVTMDTQRFHKRVESRGGAVI